MYKYRITEITLLGRVNYYTLEALFEQDEIMLPLKEIKGMLLRNQISNAVYCSQYDRPRIIPDTVDSLIQVKESLEENNEVIVYVRGKYRFGFHYYYIKFYNQRYRDITEVLWAAINRFHTITKTKEIAIRSEEDPVIDIIRLINFEASMCRMEPIISEEYHIRKKLGTGKGGETKLVNRCLEEAGLDDFYIHILKTGKFGFYMNKMLIEQGDEPKDFFEWIESVTVYNDDIDKGKVQLAKSIYNRRKGLQ